MLIPRLAWRYTWRNPRRTGIVVTAVGVGIAGCVLSMAINYGAIVQMVETAIATDLGHLQIHASGFEEDPELGVLLRDGGRAAQEALAQRPEVRAWAPRVRGQGLVQSARANVGVRVLAVDVEREAQVSRVADSMVEGSWFGEESRRVLIGEGLARRLQVGVGDKVVLGVQDLTGDLTGQAYRVGGLFQTPSRSLDEGAVFMPLAEAQSLFGLGDSVSEIVVLIHERWQLGRVGEALSEALGDSAEVRSWEELQPLLVHMIRTFDQMAWYTYAGVFIAMAFGIANVLLMAVYERTRELGMMMAVGLSRARVVALVTLESLIVTLVGLGAGVALAGLALFALRDGIDLSAYAEGLSSFGVGTRIIPVVRAGDMIVPLVVAVVTAVLAGLWPALRAARSLPATALRHV